MINSFSLLIKLFHIFGQEISATITYIVYVCILSFTNSSTKYVIEAFNFKVHSFRLTASMVIHISIAQKSLFFR